MLLNIREWPTLLKPNVLLSLYEKPSLIESVRFFFMVEKEVFPDLDLITMPSTANRQKERVKQMPNTTIFFDNCLDNIEENPVMNTKLTKHIDFHQLFYFLIMESHGSEKVQTFGV